MTCRLFTTKLIDCFFLIMAIILCMTGCAASHQRQDTEVLNENQTEEDVEDSNRIVPTSEIQELEDDFSVVRFDGEDGFDLFLEQGGASSDADVVRFLAENLLSDLDIGDLLGGIFGCSTIAVASPDGEQLFGRNFDWNHCKVMVVESHPENGYASISTVNMDFITQNAGGLVGMALNVDEIQTLAALYAPLDGMNEAGLAVSVNMIQDRSVIDQNTGKVGLTTTTAIRLLLNQAGSVEEALQLLAQYDLHGSMGMMVHFAIADATGRSVAVEYIDNEMIVIETPVVTNFYLAEGEKQGIGTQQSHERYEILGELLEQHPQMEMVDVRNALDRVSKDNFEEFASTEWSIVMNLSTREVRYYHREDYSHHYSFLLEVR